MNAVQYLLTHGADVNCGDELVSFLPAALLSLVDLTVCHRATLLLAARDGDTPLYASVIAFEGVAVSVEDSISIVNILLENDADSFQVFLCDAGSHVFTLRRDR